MTAGPRDVLRLGVGPLGDGPDTADPARVPDDDLPLSALDVGVPDLGARVLRDEFPSSEEEFSRVLVSYVESDHNIAHIEA